MTSNPSAHKKTSYKGVIIFAIIALFIYGAWTKARVDICLNDARDMYVQDWAAACKNTAKAMKEGYVDCINNPNETASDCKRIWNPKQDASKNCSLPNVVADRIDSRFEKTKNFCISYG